jgi:uridine kinase
MDGPNAFPEAELTGRRRPFVIGIAGGSGSGKTTVTAEVMEAVGPHAVSVIELDSYYRDRAGMPFEERTRVNYDHPDAFEWPLLFDQIAQLRDGRTVAIPVYDYRTHTRSEATRTVGPSAVVVVDGILTLYEPQLRELLDLKVFVDVDADLRLIRRMRRDMTERGRTADSVVTQYLETVRPMHESFVEPTKRFADVIIPHGGRNPAVQGLLAALLREVSAL